MRIALAQMDTTAGDFAVTVEHMVAYGTRAHELEADLLVFPATVLMGPDPQSLAQDEGYVADAGQALEQLAERLEVPCLVPFSYEIEGAIGKDIALVRDGIVMPLALTALVTTNEAPDFGKLLTMLSDAEESELVPCMDSLMSNQASPLTVSFGEITLGIARTREGLTEFGTKALSADIVCYLPVEGYNTDDECSCGAPSVVDGCFVREAAQADAWLVVAQAVGGYEDMVFCGGSFIMSPWGEVAAAAPSFMEDLLVYDIDLENDTPLTDTAEVRSYDRVHFLWDACVLATRDHMSKRQLDGVALVLDGSLNSSTLAALAVDAVGPLRVNALICAASDDARDDACALARNLRIRDVDELGDRSLSQAVDALGGEADASELAAGLVEARLGALARSRHFLALSSTDKTQLAVGLREDDPAPVAQTASFAPFGDVYCSDVARLARHRNTVSSIIPSSSLQRFVVPRGFNLEELSSQPEIMMSELDAVLLLHIERGGGLTDMAETRLGLERSMRILDRIRAGEATRHTGPLYPIVSTRSLAEAATPLTDGWRDSVRPQAPSLVTSDEISEMLHSLFEDISELEEPRDASQESQEHEQIPIVGNQMSEILGYLQDISAGKRLREQSGAATHTDGPWPQGLFSDN